VRKTIWAAALMCSSVLALAGPARAAMDFDGDADDVLLVGDKIFTFGADQTCQITGSDGSFSDCSSLAVTPTITKLPNGQVGYGFTMSGFPQAPAVGGGPSTSEDIALNYTVALCPLHTPGCPNPTNSTKITDMHLSIGLGGHAATITNGTIEVDELLTDDLGCNADPAEGSVPDPSCAGDPNSVPSPDPNDDSGLHVISTGASGSDDDNFAPSQNLTFLDVNKDISVVCDADPCTADFTMTQLFTQNVPEPASIALIGVGLMGLGRRLRARAKA
jgi:hypothetical protein